MKVYLKKKFLGIFLLSLTSGIPLPLTASTLTVMLAENDINIALIGLFALVGTPYSFKFVWAPLIDNIRLPVIDKMLGRRKSWLIFTVFFLSASVASVSLLDISNNLKLLSIIAFAISSISATYDIIFDAFRIELLEDEEQAAGVSTCVIGYRIGMLISSAGALYLAHFYSWQITYLLMSLIILSSILVVFFMHEKKTTAPKEYIKYDYLSWFINSYIIPLKDFMVRTNPLTVLIFIFLFKLGDAYAGLMTSPFLISLGFTKLEIANIVKVFGLSATLAGALLGGILASKTPLKNSILIALILQILSNLAFIPLINFGPNNILLISVIAIENFASGLGTSILLAYLATLCNKKFTASQFALLSSVASIGRTTISSSAGYVVATLGWKMFFIFSACLSVPALFIIKSALKRK